ncbi:hypothetical protein [Actinomadura luteofluorescens]|uniref:hypothetical protein n=1 Tax=Actinomadura luteofluorescens TaxID=46163 RepID=UPI003D8B923F
MTDPSSPIAVMDAQDRGQGTPALQGRLDWLKGEGIDPSDVRHVDVYKDDDGGHTAIITMFLRGEDGQKFCDRDHEHTRGTGACRFAEGARRVRVTSPPPEVAMASPDGPR